MGNQSIGVVDTACGSRGSASESQQNYGGSEATGSLMGGTLAFLARATISKAPQAMDG